MSIAVSYNQPKFCPNPVWNPNGITFADSSTFRGQPESIFVDTNDAIYLTDDYSRDVTVFYDGKVTHTSSWLYFFYSVRGLFVTTNGDIYTSGRHLRDDIYKWVANTRQWVLLIPLKGDCEALFIDTNDNIYCSDRLGHQIVKRSLKNNPNAAIIVAGNGAAGSLSHMLHHPRGIFVDINLDLYVADSSNNRIQRFVNGQLNGITVAGNNLTIKLLHPTGIVLDAEKHLFIVDHFNHRIVRSGSNGFQCVVGCSNSWGSASNQFKNPLFMSFDSLGNIFVTDYDNYRVQKFLLVTNLCTSKY